MHPQSSVGTVGWFQSFFHAKHFGSVLALSFSLLLAACGGGGSVVTEMICRSQGRTVSLLRLRVFLYSNNKKKILARTVWLN